MSDQTDLTQLRELEITIGLLADCDHPTSRGVCPRCVAEAVIAAGFGPVREVEEQRKRLQRWKEEALPVIFGLQDLGRALDLPLGTSITGPAALAAVKDLRGRLAKAEKS